MSENAPHQHDTQHGTHDGGPGATVQGSAADAAAIWDERYRSKPQMWSGKPNPQLVREAGGLRPGKALDLGCGEGADAIWLAQQGWTVTAVDVSAVALDRARSHEKAALARESVHAAEAPSRAGSPGSRPIWSSGSPERPSTW